MGEPSANKIKKRCNNFSAEEEQLLVSLVEEHKSIIENKKSGAVSWKDKELAWKNIEAEFNCRNSSLIFRNIKGLKEKYANLKRVAKKKYSTSKQNSIKTGGGPCEAVEFTPTDVAIHGLLAEQISGLQNNYDNDAMALDTISGADNDQNEEVQELETKEEADNTADNAVKWTTYTPKNLKTPLSNELRIPKVSKATTIIKRKNGTKKYVGINYEVMETKREFLQLQKEKFLEEHELRIQLLKKKIELVERKLNAS